MTKRRPRGEGWRVRVTFLGLGIVPILVVVALLLGVTSLKYLYTGDPSASGDVTTTRSVSTAIESCSRSGPVSEYGYGYWWSCGVTLTFPGGRAVHTTLAPSIVTPADRPHPPLLVEHCQRRGFTDCRYSRPGGSGVVAFLLLLVTRVLFAVGAVVVVLAGIPLLQGLLGHRLIERYFSRPPKPRPDGEGPTSTGNEVATGRLLFAVIALYALIYLSFLLIG